MLHPQPVRPVPVAAGAGGGFLRRVVSEQRAPASEPANDDIFVLSCATKVHVVNTVKSHSKSSGQRQGSARAAPGQRQSIPQSFARKVHVVDTVKSQLKSSGQRQGSATQYQYQYQYQSISIR